MSFQAQPLVGHRVQLEPLEPAHREPLREAANDERIWRHTIEVARGKIFDVWFDQALAEQQACRRIPFAVRNRSDGRLISGIWSYRKAVSATAWFSAFLRANGRAFVRDCNAGSRNEQPVPEAVAINWLD
ncbi:MAG: hypothetical protein EXS09_04570 [Gemmataceae bacterium]|nr:hypothetical protein [Gemmataceae bacterium]